MSAHIVIDLIGNAHHHRDQQQLQQNAHQCIGRGDDGKEHRIAQDGQNDDHEQEAGTAAGMVARHFAHILHGQLQAALITEDSLMLRAMVGKHPADVLHF